MMARKVFSTSAITVALWRGTVVTRRAYSTSTSSVAPGGRKLIVEDDFGVQEPIGVGPWGRMLMAKRAFLKSMPIVVVPLGADGDREDDVAAVLMQLKFPNGDTGRLAMAALPTCVCLRHCRFAMASVLKETTV